MTALSRMLLVPMRSRNPHEPGRTATTLELFFDLVFVIAVSIAGRNLHHALSEGHVAEGLTVFALMFFAIWWAWMNFTWFATSFGTDDWLYRVMTVVQMGGVLVFAAGLERAFTEHDFSITILGYVIMRVAMIGQWLRAAASDASRRRTALIYAGGIAAVQVAWVLVLLIPGEPPMWLLALLGLSELAIPVIAERFGETTTWHPHHITERYGLFTIIVLGESLLASANGIIDAIHAEGDLLALIGIAITALVVTACLWWIYFWPPHHDAIGSLWQSLRYGYVHYVVFAAAAMVSVGIEVEIDLLTDHTELDRVAASLALTLPIALFMLGIWVVAIQQAGDRVVNAVVPIGAVAIVASTWLPLPELVAALILVAVVVVMTIRRPPGVDTPTAFVEG